MVINTIGVSFATSHKDCSGVLELVSLFELGSDVSLLLVLDNDTCFLLVDAVPFFLACFVLRRRTPFVFNSVIAVLLIR